jgi:WD40 repeat protein
MQKMENWPKLPNQRLPKKAHLFKGHEGAITALEAMGGRRPQFLSASLDGTIRAWNTAKGTEDYSMDGFDSVLSSLCLQGSETADDMLITNGMRQYVCVHDFSMGLAGESVDDYLERWDE